MDPKEAADAARNYITVALPGLDPAQLSLEEVVPAPITREWRVTFSFPSPGGQQGQQSVSVPRSYKAIIISDADGSVISMTDRTPCAPKCVCKIPAQAARWWDSLRTWFRILFVYPIATVGWASLILLYFRVGFGDSTSVNMGDTFILSAVLVGIIIGVVAEGRWWRKKKRCSC